jgi:hypothetical protein
LQHHGSFIPSETGLLQPAVSIAKLQEDAAVRGTAAAQPFSHR